MSRLDFKLISRLKRGDQSSFNEIYSLYYLRLYYFAREYLMNEKDAEDIVHNAFTKLWQKKSLLLENTNIEAWLYKVTRNEALSMIDHRRVVDKHRKDYERKMLDINSGALRSFELPQDTVFDISDIIEQLLASMSPQCRKVFIYSRTMSYKEIAEKMSISVKTVESHMSKALVIFRKGLSDYFLIFFILFLI